MKLSVNENGINEEFLIAEDHTAYGYAAAIGALFFTAGYILAVFGF
jgi:hypothetical protein